jgi:hypothetical protein
VKQVHQAQAGPAAPANASNLKPNPRTPGAAEKPESYPEIPLAPDAQIPLSSFKFKIPVPLYWIDQNGTLQDGSSGSHGSAAGPP